MYIDVSMKSGGSFLCEKTGQNPLLKVGMMPMNINRARDHR